MKRKIEEFLEKYPTKAKREEVLNKMTKEEIDK